MGYCRINSWSRNMIKGRWKTKQALKEKVIMIMHRNIAKVLLKSQGNKEESSILIRLKRDGSMKKWKQKEGRIGGMTKNRNSKTTIFMRKWMKLKRGSLNRPSSKEEDGKGSFIRSSLEKAKIRVLSRNHSIREKSLIWLGKRESCMKPSILDQVWLNHLLYWTGKSIIFTFRQSWKGRVFIRTWLFNRLLNIFGANSVYKRSTESIGISNKDCLKNDFFLLILDKSILFELK